MFLLSFQRPFTIGVGQANIAMSIIRSNSNRLAPAWGKLRTA